MSAGWVAGSVRAQAMARRRLGPGGARDVAVLPSLDDALDALAHSPYGSRLRAGERTLASAGRGIAETLLWNLRVLAGWLPAAGAETLRVLGGWFEIANVDDHVRAIAGDANEPPFRLGTLSTVWPLLRATGSLDDLRAALARSPWSDPGGATARDIQLGMRLVWAERVFARVEPARPWAAGAVALVVARERFASARALPAAAASAAGRVIGIDPTTGSTMDEFVAALPSRGRWVLADIGNSAEMWRGEVRWWRRLRTDGGALLAGAGFGAARAVGAAAALAADAWLVRGAVEAAAHGGAALEVFDAMA